MTWYFTLYNEFLYIRNQMIFKPLKLHPQLRFPVVLHAYFSFICFV